MCLKRRRSKSNLKCCQSVCQLSFKSAASSTCNFKNKREAWVWKFKQILLLTKFKAPHCNQINRCLNSLNLNKFLIQICSKSISSNNFTMTNSSNNSFSSSNLTQICSRIREIISNSNITTNSSNSSLRCISISNISSNICSLCTINNKINSISSSNNSTRVN